MEREKLLDYLSQTEDNRRSPVTSIQDKDGDKEEFQDIVDAVSKVMMEHDKEGVEERTAQSDEDSPFFADPHNPEPSEWSSWPPEKWLEWSESEEYRELYSNPLNSYRPPQVSQPDRVPILDYREKFPVIVSKLSNARPSSSPPSPLRAEGNQSPPSRSSTVHRGKVSAPPETFFPAATASPTRNPDYIYREDYREKSSPYLNNNLKSVLSDVKPEFIINEPRARPSSLTSDYLYNQGFESSGLPASENQRLSALPFERFKDRESGAVMPDLLLLSSQPLTEGLPAAEIDFDPFQGRPGQPQPKPAPSFQEGVSPLTFSDDLQSLQGSQPAQGSVQQPQARPGQGSVVEQQNRFRPPQYRPLRPGQRPANRNRVRPPQRNNPNLPDNSDLSPEVFLPPLAQNNPNFQTIFNNPDQADLPSINPYFPLNVPNYFPNQYQPPQQPQGASSSTSTSTGGGGGSAAASSSAGHSSSSSTSVTAGGNNNNDNKYYECTGDNCQEVRQPALPATNPEENRNVFFQEEISSTAAPNFLENITFPRGGNNQVNLNIPTGVSPPPDLQKAINRGGTLNLNCDRVRGCPTMIPPDQRSTTSTTTPGPAIRISISPLFGNINRGNNEESSAGADRMGDAEEYNENIRQQYIDNARVTEFSEELPDRGIGDDYINEIYELEAPQSFPQSQSERVASISRPSAGPVRRVSGLDRVADIPRRDETEEDSTSEDLRNIVKALSGLIELLNNTGHGQTQGRNKLTLTTRSPSGAGGGLHLGNKRYPVKNIIFDDEAATFSKIKSQHLPDGDIIYFNLQKTQAQHPVSRPRPHPFPSPSSSSSSSSSWSVTTIPPHLIPLGPDGSPILRPDGTFISPGAASQTGAGGLQQRFPYLSDRAAITTSTTSRTTTTTTAAPATTSEAQTGNSTEPDDRNMITRTIDMIHDMPMETKRHMLANMIVGVPMAALTMAAVGLPPLAIAPLATVVPGFVFAAFTEVNNQPASHSTEDRFANGTQRRHGLSGLIAALRDFNTNRRENQTLNIRHGTSDNHHHHG